MINNKEAIELKEKLKGFKLILRLEKIKIM